MALVLVLVLALAKMKTFIASLWLLMAYPETMAQVACLSDLVWFEARGEPALAQVAVAYAALDRHGNPCLARQDRGYPWRAKTANPKDPAARVEYGYAVESAIMAMTGLVDRPIPAGTIQFDRCMGDYRGPGRWKQGMTMVKMLGRTCFFRQQIVENVP